MSIWPLLLAIASAATALGLTIIWETRDERAKCRNPRMLKGRL